MAERAIHSVSFSKSYLEQLMNGQMVWHNDGRRKVPCLILQGLGSVRRNIKVQGVPEIASNTCFSPHLCYVSTNKGTDTSKGLTDICAEWKAIPLVCNSLRVRISASTPIIVVYLSLS